MREKDFGIIAEWNCYNNPDAGLGDKKEYLATMIKEGKQYDNEFKQKAVELSDAKGIATEIAEELGLLPQVFYN